MRRQRKELPVPSGIVLVLRSEVDPLVHGMLGEGLNQRYGHPYSMRAFGPTRIPDHRAPDHQARGPYLKMSGC